MEGLKKYYSQLLEDCQNSNNLTTLSPEVINNPAIYSLMASKYHLADEKGIKINLDVFMDLREINMKIYEFSRIFGILMDNAIEASSACEDKNINVTLRKDFSSNTQLLIIENTYPDKNIDTKRIYEKGFSTKEGNTGLGLWEVNKIVKKNKDKINLITSNDETIFRQQLEMYHKV